MAVMCLRSVKKRHLTFEVSLGDGLQPVALQQQQRQVVQVLESSRADGVDLVVCQPQLPESSWQSTGNRAQVIVVGKKITQLGLVLQCGQVQLVALQLVVVQDEPPQPRDVGQSGGGQRRDVVALETTEENSNVWLILCGSLCTGVFTLSNQNIPHSTV